MKLGNLNTGNLRIPKLSRKTKRLLLLAGGLVMVAAIILLGLAAVRLRRIRGSVETYETHFLEGTKINGIDVSGKTAEQAEDALLAASADYTLNLIFRENRMETISGADIGFHYVAGDMVSSLLKEQDTEQLYQLMLKGEEPEAPAPLTVALSAEYDEQMLRRAVHALPELQVASMTPAKDAYMDYADAQYVVVPANPGTMLYPDKVLEAVRLAVGDGETTLDLSAMKDIYETQPGTSTAVEKDLQEKADKLNELVPGSITYTLPGGREAVLNGPVMRKWLEEDYDGSPYKDDYTWEMHLQEYVEDLAESVNTVGKIRTFASTGAGDIRIGGGNYGYELNQEEELEKLRGELEAGSVVTREPVWTSWETSEENNGFGNSYVEIDCSRQHMWIYVDGAVVLETDVVTGMMDGKMATPAGTCLLMGKERDTELVGEYYEYRTPVSYWMPFNGGVGMHDAWWRSEFGGNIYLWDGSNGCVNMPPEMAEKAFDIVTYEMPIVVYYSEGLEGETSELAAF